MIEDDRSREKETHEVQRVVPGRQRGAKSLLHRLRLTAGSQNRNSRLCSPYERFKHGITGSRAGVT